MTISNKSLISNWSRQPSRVYFNRTCDLNMQIPPQRFRRAPTASPNRPPPPTQTSPMVTSADLWLPCPLTLDPNSLSRSREGWSSLTNLTNCFQQTLTHPRFLALPHGPDLTHSLLHMLRDGYFRIARTWKKSPLKIEWNPGWCVSHLH